MSILTIKMPPFSARLARLSFPSTGAARNNGPARHDRRNRWEQQQLELERKKGKEGRTRLGSGKLIRISAYPYAFSFFKTATPV